MIWPEFDGNGDLPVGIHQATLAEIMSHFGVGSVRRRLVAERLERIHALASGPDRWQDSWCLDHSSQRSATQAT